MASWLEEALVLSKKIKLDGGSDQEVEQFLKIVQDRCKSESDYRFLLSSNLLEPILELYRSRDVYGVSVLSGLIGKAATLPKNDERVGLNFLVRIIQELTKGDELYKKSRRLFIRTGPTLSPGGTGNIEFLEFFHSIIDELEKGLNEICETSLRMPDLSLLTSYVSFLERTPDDIKNDRDSHQKFKSLVYVLDKTLSDSSFKQNMSIFIDMLNQLSRLEKVILGGEEFIGNLVDHRAPKIIDLTTMSIGSNGFSEPDVLWFQEKGLLVPLFSSLNRKIECIYQKVKEQDCSPIDLDTYKKTLESVTRISKFVDGGENLFDDLLKNHNEEHSVMDTISVILEKKFCSDETLSCMDSLMTKADLELKKLLTLSIIPNIRDGTPFEIEISRAAVLEESRECFINASCEDLRGNLFVKFTKELGIGTSLIREWLYLVSEKMLDPKCKFFKRDNEDRSKILPVLVHVDDLHFYNFFGRIIALALMHHVQIGLSLDPILAKMLAELEVTMDDIKKSDAVLYGNMMYLAESELEDNDKDASNVINENSKDLVNEYIIQNIDEKVRQMKNGIDCIFGTPVRRIIFFQTIELSHLNAMIRGETEISVEDWEENTVWDRNDIQIHSFWKIVQEYSAEEKRDLLFYWASIKNLPPGGFKNLEHPLVINKSEGDPHLRAATCSNTLHIPSISYEMLKVHLLASIKEPTFDDK